MSRTRAITSAELHTLLRRLDDPARLAVKIAADTGLRVSDILALRGDLQVPVKFVGVGEGIDDLQPFDPDAFAAGMFGE